MGKMEKVSIRVRYPGTVKEYYNEIKARITKATFGRAAE